MILLHGLAGHAGEWLGTMRHLFPRCRTVALDQRGHGRSTRMPDDLSRDAFVDDVAAVIGAAALSVQSCSSGSRWVRTPPFSPPRAIRIW